MGSDVGGRRWFGRLVSALLFVELSLVFEFVEVGDRVGVLDLYMVVGVADGVARCGLLCLAEGAVRVALRGGGVGGERWQRCRGGVAGRVEVAVERHVGQLGVPRGPFGRGGGWFAQAAHPRLPIVGRGLLLQRVP